MTRSFWVRPVVRRRGEPDLENAADTFSVIAPVAVNLALVARERNSTPSSALLFPHPFGPTRTVKRSRSTVTFARLLKFSKWRRVIKRGSWNRTQYTPEAAAGKKTLRKHLPVCVSPRCICLLPALLCTHPKALSRRLKNPSPTCGRGDPDAFAGWLRGEGTADRNVLRSVLRPPRRSPGRSTDPGPCR